MRPVCLPRRPAVAYLFLVSDPPKPQGLGSYKKQLGFWARLGRLGRGDAPSSQNRSINGGQSYPDR